MYFQCGVLYYLQYRILYIEFTHFAHSAKTTTKGQIKMSNYVRKTDNPKMGRPKKEFDKSIFENLCNIHCTKSEISDVFECDENTVNAYCKRTYNTTFSVVYKRLSSNGKVSLRRMQWKSAENGNVAMQMFLGKQYLGQKDNPETEEEDNGLMGELVGLLAQRQKNA